MKPTLRVLIYSHAFAPKIGGVETLVMSLALGLAGSREAGAADRPQVTVVTRTPGGSFDDRSLPFHVVRRPSLPRLVQLIRQADVVHLGGPAFLPLMVGLILRKPVVVEHSAYQAICPNGLLLDERTKAICPGHFMARRYGECLGCNAANAAWSQSAAMLLWSFPRHWMCRKAGQNVVPTAHVGKRLGLPRTVTIYHGVPQPVPAPEPAARNSAEPVCFAYVGRLVSEKGLVLLVEAAGRLHAAGRKFRVKIIGDGPERQRLEAAADRMDLRAQVEFTGYRSGQALATELQDVTVVVMPSVWEEVAGLAAMEHMMRGRTVIATDIGGLGELVDGTGLKFPLGDAGALADCMQRVLDQPSLAAALGRQAKLRAEAAFGEERMASEHLVLYRQLVDGVGAPH